ncbi:MAG: aspartyl/asparaginyl beta-hydroxylase domain-containing protein [Hyphomonadaceae bacterium]|nr:aspartyl/asparaginyl beta-hydroxylase domain-containing protein [Hyphomonadaceae bacterium]
MTAPEALADPAQDDARAALASFSRLIDANPNDAAAWFGAAVAHVRLGDEGAATIALQKTLTLAPRHFGALILSGDVFSRRGDLRAAAAFYASGVRFAPQDAPPPVAREIARAEQNCVRIAEEFQSHLASRLSAAGFDPSRSSPGFAKSLAAFNGGPRLHTAQKPRFYCFPDLPDTPFYDRKDFAWAPALEAATDAIAEELAGVLRMPEAFAPYVKADKSRPATNDRGMRDNPDWSACHLIENGAIAPKMAEACPRTMAALKHVPLAAVPGRSPSVLFSLLQPGMHIPPHHGFVNTRLIGHLPLITPPNCLFRVGPETREWEQGKLMLFNDTIEHEAWNKSDRLRVVLLFDFWRPELTEEERTLVRALFQAVDSYGTKAASWS